MNVLAPPDDPMAKVTVTAFLGEDIKEGVNYPTLIAKQ
jgi:hypothetical protein